MAIRLKPLKDSEMNPDGSVFESNEEFQCTLAELETEISRVFPGISKESVSIFTSCRNLENRLIVMKLD